MSYEKFCEILTAALVILPYFGLSPFLEKLLTEKYHTISFARSNGKNYHQLSCRILTCPNYMIVDDSR